MQFSLMGAGVARLHNPGRSHSGTVRALEGGRWWRRCRGRLAVPGSSDRFLAALFKLLEGPVGCCT